MATSINNIFKKVIKAGQSLPLIKEKNELQTSLDQGVKIRQMKNSRERAKRQGLSNK